MKLFYQRFYFTLWFAGPVVFTVDPLFILRSVFGYHLRSMCCIISDKKCTDCLYNRTCTYAQIFETFLPKDNGAVPGRDRASHPFVLSMDRSFSFQEGVPSLKFCMTVLGDFIKYFPYIYGAFVRAGKAGILKSRVPFEIRDIEIELVENGNTRYCSMLGNNELMMDMPDPYSWEVSETDRKNTANMSTEKEVLIEFLSPLRFKASGRYTVDFDVQAFMNCLNRRADLLCDLYGENEVRKENRFIQIDKNRIDIVRKRLYWKDVAHYSARQKRAMELGGVMGSFIIKGCFFPYELKLLIFARLFNAGKNTNFGLGQVDYWEK